jgi:hypothetical protein
MNSTLFEVKDAKKIKCSDCGREWELWTEKTPTAAPYKGICPNSECNGEIKVTLTGMPVGSPGTPGNKAVVLKPVEQTLKPF